MDTHSFAPLQRRLTTGQAPHKAQRERGALRRSVLRAHDADGGLRGLHNSRQLAEAARSHACFRLQAVQFHFGDRALLQSLSSSHSINP